MNFNRNEWIINGSLILGIVLILGLISFRHSSVGDDESASDIMAGNVTSSTLKVSSESTYSAHPSATPAAGKTPAAAVSPEGTPQKPTVYSYLGSHNIFRALATASPTAAPPTPTPEATPSLDKVVEKWVLQYGMRGTWVFKDGQNNQIEIKEGSAPYMATDGDKQCPISVEPIDKYSCNLVCGTQKKKFSMIE